MATVLVTDGNERAALAVVRSLGRAGHRLLVAAASRRSLAGVSRHVSREVLVADPLRDPAEFSSGIARIAKEVGADFIIPISEAASLALLPIRASLLPSVIPGPSQEAFLRAADKDDVLSTAKTLGLQVPKQIILGSSSESIVAGSLSFPLVVKPARSVGEDAGHRIKMGARHVPDAEALAALLRELPPSAFPVLLQERIVGPGTGIFLLRKGGRVVATFAHRRIREKPPSGGVSVLSESISGDPQLVAWAESLLGALGYEGVAMVEFKVDAASGRSFLMEINGRFWGSLQLAIDAGVDFPTWMLECEMSPASAWAPPLTWKVGRRSRWFWGDVDHLLVRLRRSSKALALPPGSPSRLGALFRFFDWRPWVERDAVFRIADPKPFIRETLAWFRNLSPSASS